MNENQLFSSFIMLNEHLYEVFIEYIVNGRIRAPPETELIEMLPTFQFGARTDRRALQCKFKSWAKRMNFENGWLKLANVGKIIIPREKCDDLIMRLHSKEHIDIDNVICQIRKTYTWTRKNFGMDRDIVVESIMRNCKEEDCHKRMRLEMARLGNSLCSSLPSCYDLEHLPEMSFKVSSPTLPCLSPYPYPIAFPLPPAYFPLQIPFFKNVCSIDSPLPASNIIDDSLLARRYSSEDMHALKEKTQENPVPNTKCVPSNTKVSEFKRPKTIHQLQILIKAAKQSPKDFPEILSAEKTHFLAKLGIAPKSICSSKTLKKFYKELKHKHYINRSCIIYRERKMLRDKNKLKKVSVEKNRHVYLGLSKEKNYPFSKLTLKPTTDKTIQNLEMPKKLKNENSDCNAFQKKRKLNHCKDQKAIEIITLDSTDEEILYESDHSPSKSIDIKIIERGSKIELSDNNATVSSNNNQSTVNFSNLTAHSNSTQSTAVSSNVTVDLDKSHSAAVSQDVTGDLVKNQLTEVSSKKVTTDSKSKLIAVSSIVCANSKNSQSTVISSNAVADSKNIQTTLVSSIVTEEKAIGNFSLAENNKVKHSIAGDKDESNESKNESEKRNYITEAIQSKPLSDKFQNNALKTERVLLPKNFSDSPFRNPLRIAIEKGELSSSKVITFPANRSLANIKRTFNQMRTQTVLKPIALQPLRPHLQLQTTSELPKQNLVLKKAYPMPLPSGSSTKLFVVDKNKKEAFYVVPPNKTVFPQDLEKVQSLAVHSAKEIGRGKSTAFMPLANKFLQLKQKNTNDNIYYEKEDLRKIDINQEMARITKWIYRMKSNLNPGMFTHGLEKTVLHLLSQLDIAIYLVREAKKSLMEIEQISDKKSTNTAE